LNTRAMRESISTGRLFAVWLKIGCVSFGGGAVTQYLIQENFIYKTHLISAEEYANIIAMSQLAPGINLFANAILIGRRLRGGAGIAVSLIGLIAPSAAITIGMTAAYVNFSSLHRVQSMLRTAFAAVFGISLVANWRNVSPILSRNKDRGPVMLLASLAIMLGGALVYALLSPAAVILYAAGGLCGAIVYGLSGHASRGA